MAFAFMTAHPLCIKQVGLIFLSATAIRCQNVSPDVVQRRICGDGFNRMGRPGVSMV